MRATSTRAVPPPAETDRHSDTDRVIGLAARFIASGYVFYLFVISDLIRMQAPYYPDWWTPLAMGLAFLPAVALFLASFRRAGPFIVRSSLACSVGYVLAAVGTLLLWPEGQIPNTPWLCMFPGLSAMAVALVFPARYALTYLAAVSVLSELLHLQRPDEQKASSVLSVIDNFTFSLPFVTALLVIIHTARVLDATRPQVYVAAAATAAARARELEHERFTDLIHDWVMAGLGSVSRHAAPETVRHQAQVALEKLDSVRDGPAGADEPVDAMVTAAALRTSVRDVSPTLDVDVHFSDGTDDLLIPHTTVRALSVSVAESVRNCFKHAGRDVVPVVTADFRADGVTITIADDGVGFDVEKHRPDRFGLRRMRDQVNRLDGASLRIRSQPGDGTTVTLTWTAS
ncbi:MAG: hypothetical protein QM809_02195 [Gordonia sp. (in: high G+C Gram-positive bacteria)]|uniref:sensor histidine kinase n=1 Tax=Gordonia sp. (in: high G+C Gram-positive bacteria) TaxID=84139 RepID=UPI0039E3BE65